MGKITREERNSKITTGRNIQSGDKVLYIAAIAADRHFDEERMKRDTKHDLFFCLKDGTWKHLNVYEPHGFFWVEAKEIYIVYGHEEILVLDGQGTEVEREYTR